MKKMTVLELMLMFTMVSGVAFAVRVSAEHETITLANTSVAYPLSSDSGFTTSEYTIEAGQNNTGKVYVGSSSVSSSDYGVSLNAGDTVSADKADIDYTLSEIYIRGSVANDTVTVLYNNV